MGEFEHWGNYPTGWENPLVHSVSVPSGAGWNVPSGANLNFTMLKTPMRPVVVAALIEQREEALAAKKAGGSAKRKHVELLKSWLIDTGCGQDLVGKRDLRNVLVKLSNAISPPDVQHREWQNQSYRTSPVVLFRT